MSRIGKLPIPVPSGVEVALDNTLVTVKGPKGTLSHTVASPITVGREDDGTIVVNRPNDERTAKSLHGLSRTLIANMVTGVTQGYEKRLEIHGVGYRAAKTGNDIELSVGFSHTVRKAAPAGIEFEVPQPTRITIRGIDKELVGQTAAEIRAIKKPEPYKAKGIRYEGEHIRRKAGKAAKAGG